MDPLMKSNGGRRGAREVPTAAPAPAAEGRHEGCNEGRRWVAVTEALPAPEPGYRASRGTSVRNETRVALGHWRPAGTDATATWAAAWIDIYGTPLAFEPTHWWLD